MSFKRILWTEHEIATLKAIYPGGGFAECVASIPSRSSWSIRNKIKEIGLLRDYKISDRLRFEKAFRITPSCWIWEKALDNKGYGRFTVLQKPVLAHRFSFELYRHPIPDGICVCHRCDNPLCVNPDHFFLGSMKDNAQDMVKKGRDSVSKLKPDEVKSIRSSGLPAKELASIFNISLMSIYNIKSGKTWASLL